MNKPLKLSQRSQDLTNIINALNEWATAPEGTAQVALKAALNVYGRATRAGVYKPIGWEFCYARNTLNKSKAPLTKNACANFFEVPEGEASKAPSGSISKGSERVISAGAGEAPF